MQHIIIGNSCKTNDSKSILTKLATFFYSYSIIVLVHDFRPHGVPMYGINNIIMTIGLIKVLSLCGGMKIKVAAE